MLVRKGKAMKKILILGASGFVGKNIYEYLQERYNVDAPTHTQLDVIDEKSLFNKLNSVSYDVVINALDGKPNDPNYFVNRMRMYMNLSRHNDMYGKMIWFGSGAEYGRQEAIVKVSEHDFDKLLPSDDYGFCLHQMSQNTKQSDNIYNFRLFGIFGKYEIWKSRFISNAICKGLYGYPISIRQDRVMDYLHIDDLCKIAEWACENQPKHHDYNATSGKSYHLKELADIVNSQLDVKVPVMVTKDGMASEYTSNNDRLLADFLGFKPEPMEVSVDKLMRYYKEHLGEISLEQLLY